jgi:hypothetical protein
MIPSRETLEVIAPPKEQSVRSTRDSIRVASLEIAARLINPYPSMQG